MSGPRNAFSESLHAEKYRMKGESFKEAMTRIADTLKDSQEHFSSFREILLDMRFLPAGRIQAAVGNSRNITPYNCYVSGTIEDSYVDGAGSIMHRVTEAAQTMRMGGGIGYDFSTLRPRGSLIKKLSSSSSGPVSFMQIFDAVCRATSSSGHRRGAQMGVLRIDHPDIEEFIKAKQNSNFLTGFNLSVAITDEFMQAVTNDSSFTLRFGGTAYQEIRALDLWNSLMRTNYDWAEPGVLFIDTINNMNNLSYAEVISATNPCGEQPLPPFGACLLGSFNLTKYLIRKTPTAAWTFNWTQLLFDIPHIVRAMDNIIDLARYPLFEQEQEAQNKRRMGLGVTGAANCIETLGAPYGSPSFIKLLEQILSTIRDECYKASIDLAKEKGAFPTYIRDKYTSSNFIKTLPEEIQEDLYVKGIRNSHLLSIAPTGTISLTADNISSGIEPVFAYKLQRTVIGARGPQLIDLEDYGLVTFGTRGRTAEHCTVNDHLEVLACASEYVDSAVSKTCNVNTLYPFEDFKTLYHKAWKAGCKGCTTFRLGSKRSGILSSEESPPKILVTPEGEGCSFDPVTGQKNCE